MPQPRIHSSCLQRIWIFFSLIQKKILKQWIWGEIQRIVLHNDDSLHPVIQYTSSQNDDPLRTFF